MGLEAKSATPEKTIALIGNVNTQEVFALRLQSENVRIEGFFTSPNQAFASLCHETSEIDRNDLQGSLIQRLINEHYDAIVIGPISAALVTSRAIVASGLQHSGPTPEQLQLELDKSLLPSIFPPFTGVLPKSMVFDGKGERSLKEILENDFAEGFVLKFVGDYSKHFEGSEAGRVIFGSGSQKDWPRLLDFANKSLLDSGKVLIQEFVRGSEFSFNAAVDSNGHIFRLGENVCYKRRGEGDVGPLCDGTGSISINGSLPFLTEEDIRFIEEKVIAPYLREAANLTGRPLISILNLDMMKSLDGRIVLFEINARAAGGHTMSTVIPCLKTPLLEVFSHMQNGTLDQIKPEFFQKVAIAASAYPSYYPATEPPADQLREYTITKQLPEGVNVFTGWVDFLREDATSRTLRLHNAPSFIFQVTSDTVEEARNRLYTAMQSTVGDSLDYRRDIGLELL